MRKFALLILLLSGLNFAQTDSVKNYLLGEVVVSGSGTSSFENVSQFSIDLKEIKAADPESIADMLNYHAGVYVKYSSRNEAILNIRGYDQRQIAVYFDGVPIYIPYDGIVDLNKLPVASVSKITVNKNMPSMLYGANTMGGTINIITDEVRKGVSSRLRLQTGESHHVSLENGGTLGSFFWKASGTYSQSDGFNLSKSANAFKNEDGGIRDNSQFDSYSGFIKAGYRFNPNTNMALSFYHNDNSNGVPPNAYARSPRYWRFSEWKKSVLNFMYETVLTGSFRIKGNVFYDKYKNVLDSYDDATFTTQTKKYAFTSTYDDHSVGGNLFMEFDSGIFEPTKLAAMFKKDVHKEQGNPGQPYSNYESDTYTMGLEQEVKISEDILGIGGLNYDVINPVNANGAALREKSTSLSGYAGLSFILNNNLRANLHLSNRNRFPTLKELYSEVMGKNIANPTLKSERSLNVEVGLMYRINSDLSLSGNFFSNQIEDLIQLVDLPANKRQFQNIGIADVKGAEFEAAWASKGYNASLVYTYMSARNETPGAASKNLQYKPAHMLHLNFGTSYDFGFMWAIETSYFAKQFDVDPDNLVWVTLPDYLLVNARFSYNVYADLDLFLRINNIFDKYYESQFGLPQAGRNLIVGVDLPF